MADSLAAPPAERLIPVTRGCDRSFTLQRVDPDGLPVPFADGTSIYVQIDIDKSAPTRVDAVMSGATAAIIIPDSVCDQVRTGTRWRAILDQGDLDTALLVGKFERHDG